MESSSGADHVSTLTVRNDMANALMSVGRTAQAVSLFEATLRAREAKADPTIRTRSSAAATSPTPIRGPGGSPKRCAYQSTLEVMNTKLGPDHPYRLTVRNNLADALMSVGRTAEASPCSRPRSGPARPSGPDHPDTLVSRGNLAWAYYETGRTAQAIAMYELTLRAMESKIGPDHPYTLWARVSLASAYESVGRWDEAERLFRDAVARARLEKPDSPALADDLAELGRDLLVQERYSEAEPLLRECLAIRQRAMPDDWKRYDTTSLLGGALLGQGRYAEAERFLVPGYQGLKARAASIPAPDWRLGA